MSAAGSGLGRRLDLEGFLASETGEHRRVLDELVGALSAPFTQVLQLWEQAVRAGGKLLLFGNGGSAADAQHLAAELVIRYRSTRAAIGAIALSPDSSVLTAAGNDLGFDSVFARQIEALGRPGDLLVGISTSGSSPNVLAGLREGRARGLVTTGLIGADGGAMLALCDAAVVVPSASTARIQEMHILVGHLLCRALERRLGLAE